MPRASPLVTTSPQAASSPASCPGPFPAAAGGGPGAYHGDLVAVEDLGVAAAVEHRRRTGDGGEPRGVAARADRHEHGSGAPEKLPLPVNGIPVDIAYPRDRRAGESQPRELALARLEQSPDAPEPFHRPEHRMAVARSGAGDREPSGNVGFGGGGRVGSSHAMTGRRACGNGCPGGRRVSIPWTFLRARRPCGPRRFPCRPGAHRAGGNVRDLPSSCAEIRCIEPQNTLVAACTGDIGVKHTSAQPIGPHFSPGCERGRGDGRASAAVTW